MLALLAGMAAGGCAAAAPLAVSAALSAAPLLGGRSVERTVGASLSETWIVVERALNEMAFSVESREREGAGAWRLRGVAEDVTVEATLERVTSKITRVTMRVETGRLLPDRKTADVLHEQVVKLLDAANRTAPSQSGNEASTEVLRSLDAEVRRLRTEIEERRSSVPLADAPSGQAPVLRVDPSAVITVPVSAALPSATGAVAPVSVVQPIGAVAPTRAGALAETSPVENPSGSTMQPIAPLRPADALTPVPPVSARRSGS
jgi:hypothetical protein